MKRLILCLTILLFSIAIGYTVSAQVTPPTKVAQMVFDSHTHDFGTIKEVDGDVTHVFRFKNEGTLPLVIKSVGVSCGCTTPLFSKEPILPNKESELSITFDPMNRPGRFDKVVTIFCNDPRRNIRLTVTGDVVPRPRTIKDDYPYSVSDGLRIADRYFMLGTLSRNAVTVRTVGIANSSNVAIDVDVLSSHSYSHLNVVPRKRRLAPGERSEIMMTFDARNKPELWGKFRYGFSLVVNGNKHRDSVAVVATFVDNFAAISRTELKFAPRADYSSFFYHFSDQPQGKKLVRQFKIRNGGTNDLIIRHLGSKTSNLIEVSSDKMTIKSGDTATLTVTLDTKSVEGRLSEGFTVITNDPSRPARDIRVLANVVSRV